MAPIRSLADLRRELPDEAAARALLERLVWPSGPHCPGCSSLRPWRFHDEGRRSRSGLFQCAEPECGRQFTVTTGTPLHGTKLPLRTWVEALWLVLTSSKGISSVAPARQLGVTQPTAWKLGHAVRALMARAADRLAPLAGTVEVDTKRGWAARPGGCGTSGTRPARARASRSCWSRCSAAGPCAPASCRTRAGPASSRRSWPWSILRRR
jgi:transposase-like protein